MESTRDQQKYPNIDYIQNLLFEANENVALKYHLK
jgi:hypothetical protein